MIKACLFKFSLVVAVRSFSFLSQLEGFLLIAKGYPAEMVIPFLEKLVTGMKALLVGIIESGGP